MICLTPLDLSGRWLFGYNLPPHYIVYILKNKEDTAEGVEPPRVSQEGQSQTTLETHTLPNRDDVARISMD